MHRSTKGLESLIPDNDPQESWNIKGFFNDAYSRLKDFGISTGNSILDSFQTTRREILVGGIALFVGFSIWSYNHELQQNRCYRLAFSETSARERQARREGKTLNHEDDFSSKANDFYMKILESYNESWENVPFIKDNSQTFRFFLEHRVEITFKRHHYELPQLAKLIPALGDSVSKDLSYMREMGKLASDASKLLEDSWYDKHIDVTHIECHEETDCTTDENGKEDCTTTTVCETKYDYTNNTYKYYKNLGNQASTVLDTLKIKYPKISFDNMFIPVMETGAENEYAMDQSRKSELNGKRLTQEQYLANANSCIFGSILYMSMKRAESTRAQLVVEGDKWKIGKNTARHYYFERTYDYSHAEPEEFMIAESAKNTSIKLSGYIDNTFDIIDYTSKHIAAMMVDIDNYINNSYAKEDKREFRKLKDKIMSDAIEGYYAMFPNAIPLEHSKWWKVPIMGIIGGILGGLIGLGFDYLGNNTTLYGSERRKRRRNEKSIKNDYTMF